MIEIILTILLLVAIYSIFVLSRKCKVYEELYSKYDEINDEAMQTIQDTIEEMNKIDYKGTFESDDEVGLTWKNLRLAMAQLEVKLENIFEQRNE